MEDDIIKVVLDAYDEYHDYWKKTSVILPPEVYDKFAEDLKEEFCGIKILSSTYIPEGQAFILKDTLDL